MNFTAKLLLAIPAFILILFWTVIIQKLHKEPVKDQIFLGSAVIIIGLCLAFSKNYFGRKLSLKNLWLGEENIKIFYLLTGTILIIAGSAIILIS